MIGFLIHHEIETSLKYMSCFNSIVFEICSNIYLNHMFFGCKYHGLYQIIYFIFTFIKKHSISIIITIYLYLLNIDLIKSMFIRISYLAFFIFLLTFYHITLLIIGILIIVNTIIIINIISITVFVFLLGSEQFVHYIANNQTMTDLSNEHAIQYF